MDTLGSGDFGIADLYTEHQAPLTRYAMKLAHDPHRADDLVQETILRAMAHIDRLRRLNPYQRKAWLVRVLRNRFFDEQRAAKRRERLLGQLAKRAAASEASIPVSIDDILDRVPRQYRDVLEKRYVLGMNSTEIGRALGVPAATVRSRLLGAVQWLRRDRDITARTGAFSD